MMYRRPAPEDTIDQGDIIDECPVLSVVQFNPDKRDELTTKHVWQPVIVLTQTCDFANTKATRALVASVFGAQDVVARGILRAADVKGPVRAGRVWGWYFLPKSVDLGLPEMIVDLRQLHTVRLDLLTALCARGLRRARVQPLYREHLAKHFADTYSRIGLPEPYPTD